MTPHGTTLRRGFVDIAAGQVHYRCRLDGAGGRPLVLLHASPGSSKQLEPLLDALGGSRPVYAPDTLGNGDSVPPPEDAPTVPQLAAYAAEAIDALGLETCDLYGSHTGASLAAEIALARPERIAHLVLDGVGLYDPQFQQDILESYAPEVVPDQIGSQLNWAWHFCRDAHIFWPWYRRGAENRMARGLPSAQVLHDRVVEVLKAIGSYHKSYRAAFGYDKRARLPLLSVPTLAVCAPHDMLHAYFHELAALIPGCAQREIPGVETPEALVETAATIAGFLDGG